MRSTNKYLGANAALEQLFTQMNDSLVIFQGIAMSESLEELKL